MAGRYTRIFEGNKPRLLVMLAMLAWIPVCLPGQVTLPPGFERTLIAGGLNPTSMTLAPDGRIFLCEKDGRILLVRDDVLLPDPFIEITLDNSNERGLGGLAFHPEYERNNLLYIFYTVFGENRNRLSRFTANGDAAVVNSEEVLFETPELRSSIHNGGAMFFGHDNKLYLSLGEGGRSSDSKSLSTVLGKIIRLSDDGSIPVDNPYYEELTGQNRAIWASGFRNSFTMCLDPVSGDIYANDVGGGAFEEINRIERGAYYGWDDVEGMQTGQSLPAEYRDPVYAYSHAEGCAIVGSTVYYPGETEFPEKYTGKMFFGDYCQGWIRVLELNDFSVTETFMTGGDRIVALLTHPNGSIYYLERRGIGDGSPQDNTGTAEGRLWKVTYTGSGAPAISQQPADVTASAGETVHFSVEATGNIPLEYRWYHKGVSIGENTPDLEIPNVSLTDSNSEVRCDVVNAQGVVSSNSARLYVTANQRPFLTFASAHLDIPYTAGEIVEFVITANDPEDGELGAPDIQWWVDFHHDTHRHPFVSLQTGDSGQFEIPAIGETDTHVWYRIYATARDSDGLTNTAHFEIYPRIVGIGVESDPTGIAMTVDGASHETPFVIESVAGVLRLIQTPAHQILGDDIYAFDTWQDASGELIYGLYADDGQVLRAQYDRKLLGNGTGLTGRYYQNPELNGKPAITRHDSTIAFNWYFDAPFPGWSEDAFSAEWEGFILPYHTGEFQFEAIVNDGIRMFIDDKEVLSEWIPTGNPVYAKGTFAFDEIRLYPVRIAYFEQSWGAEIALRWYSELIGNEIIPASQLYPPDSIGTGPIEISVDPNPADDLIRIRVHSGALQELEARLLSSSGQLVDAFKILHLPTTSAYMRDISHLPPGIYILEVQAAVPRQQRAFSLVIH